MNRTWLLRIAAGCTVILLAGATARAAEDQELNKVQKNGFATKSFYQDYLAPRMDSRLQGEAAAAHEYVSAANPWTRDHATVERIERSAIKAGKKAVKRYLLDSLRLEARLDALSIPLFQTRASGASSGPSTGDSRARLRFGIAHLTPRAELTIPVTYGRVGLRADAQGAMDFSFESTSYTFRVDVAVDPRENTGTFTIGRRF
jgi:hypothetical protein